MGWAVGGPYEGRYVGYGVPSYCEHPDCDKTIHRGLDYACGGGVISNWENCGMYFCHDHLSYDHPQDPFVLDDDHEFDNDLEYPPAVCERCAAGDEPFERKPEHPEWAEWLLTDESWEKWRSENPAQVEAMREILA